MKQEKLTIDHNSCFVSSNLLDELDYFIGGYGNPSIEFIFSFNAFIEAYILSSNFFLTQRDMEHINITREVLFPNGRPITDLLLQSGKVSYISGIGNNITQCVYVDKVEKVDNETAMKAVQEFIKRDAERIKKNFILSDFSASIEGVKTYSVGFAGKEQKEFGNKTQVLIGETTNKPIELVKSFYDSITNINVQAALPIFTYKEQIEELNKKSISKDIYTTLSEIQGQKIEDAEKYFGSEIQVIPPMVSIVLNKSKTREDIPKVLKEIRDDFTQFRECCEKFEKNLSEAETIKDQIEAIKEYRSFWSALVKKYSGENSRIMYRFIDIANNSNYENALDNAIDNESTEDLLKDLNLGKVAGKAGNWAWDKLKQKRILNKFKGVVNLWSMFEDTPTLSKQIKDFERVFNCEIDEKRVVIAKNYLKNIK